MIIDPPPQSFEDAVEVYRSLPSKSIQDERVISFSIAPLSDYCDAQGKNRPHFCLEIKLLIYLFEHIQIQGGS